MDHEKPVTKAKNVPCSKPLIGLKYWDNLQSVRKLDFRDKCGWKDSYKDAT